MYTFVTTTYNDIKGLKILMDSLFISSILPTEIIIVDSESNDGTENYVRELQKNAKIDIVYVCKKLTIGSARNYGVSIAKSNYVLISDTYCILDFLWAENICNKLKEGYSFVGGAFKAIGNTCAQKGYSNILNQEVQIENFNPSSRSIGFSKIDFLAVGGYPSEYNQGEDTYFNIIIINSKFKFIQYNKAIVEWYGRPTFKDLFTQYKRYAIGDLDYGIFKKKFIIIPFLHPIVNVLLLIIPSIIYIAVVIILLFYKKKLNKCSLFTRLVIDYATVAGFNNYIIKKIL